MKSINNCSTVITDLKKYIKTIVELEQTCKLHIIDLFGDSWNFYFKNGSLLWAMASNHRFRRINRIGHKYCPETKFADIRLREQEISELREYLILSVLIKRNQISEKTAIAIIQEASCEVFFDCFQSHIRIKRVKSVFETSTNGVGSVLRSPLLRQPIICMDANYIMTKAEGFYKKWIESGLGDYSPNLAPIVGNHYRLQRVLDDRLCEQLLTLFDGEKTLWDLATITQQNVLDLSRSLLPCIEEGSLELLFTKDKQLSHFYFSTQQNRHNQKMFRDNPNREYVQESSLPLVVCVDNDSEICQQIAQVLNPAGYKLISVNESVLTLSMLLENKPDLIFLNSIMPIVNGYEICSQIRRIEKFKTTPIIILTDKDNVLTRVRAKMVGATDSVCKPINKNEILSVVERYLAAIESDVTIASENVQSLTV